MSSRTKEYSINRELTLAILSPSGRPLESSSTVREFVSGIRDIIMGLRNLHEMNIVHGDILAENIILTGPDRMGVTKGTLIDLDMAFLHGNENEMNLPRATSGTTKYMALELLRAVTEIDLSLKQTYCHDLESCFYVLVVGSMSIGAKLFPVNLERWTSNDL
ncbi:Bgt-51479 [Blumeria graminis f. sp. tritici]|uniref:Bgt-51479 n=1 Tax=Blumeria graminis f. sp. tritici TaxID=62690 RepID=A0A9X9MI49_BLUGR|nr:Bgt-51479 [Blumeria graminis f. sp. tritici]